MNSCDTLRGRQYDQIYKTLEVLRSVRPMVIRLSVCLSVFVSLPLFWKSLNFPRACSNSLCQLHSHRVSYIQTVLATFRLCWLHSHRVSYIQTVLATFTPC